MRLALLLFAVVALSGCRKTWTTFYTLDGQQQVLLAREGDEGYLSPEMDGIIAALRAAPENALERERAFKLADQLAAGQQRVRSETEARRPVARTAPPPVFEAPRPAPPAPPPAATTAGIDAGPLEPWAGMSEDEFVKAFGSCFTPGPAKTGPDGGTATTRMVKASDAACVTRFGTAGKETEYLFLKDGLWGSTSFTRTLKAPGEEGSTPPPPKLVTTADAGERIMTIPGAPVRDGYQREFDAGP